MYYDSSHLLGVPALLDLAASKSKASAEAAQVLAKAEASRLLIQAAFAKLHMEERALKSLFKKRDIINRCKFSYIMDCIIDYIL